MDLRWEADALAIGSITLLHGLNATADDWWRIGPALALRGWDVTALDLPGHGDGPRLTRPMDMEQLVDGVVARLSPETDVLIAHSMGCAVALEAARRRPGRLRALVLEDPGMHEGPQPDLAELVRDDAERYARDRVSALVDQQRRNPGWQPADVQRAVDGIIRAQTDLIAAGLAIQEGWKTDVLLAETTLPTLVLLAENPRSVVIGAQREKVRAAADRLVELPGGHALHRDLPAEWLHHVGEFLASDLCTRPEPW